MIDKGSGDYIDALMAAEGELDKRPGAKPEIVQVAERLVDLPDEPLPSPYLAALTAWLKAHHQMDCQEQPSRPGIEAAPWYPLVDEARANGHSIEMAIALVRAQLGYGDGSTSEESMKRMYLRYWASLDPEEQVRRSAHMAGVALATHGSETGFATALKRLRKALARLKGE